MEMLSIGGQRLYACMFVLCLYSLVCNKAVIALGIVLFLTRCTEYTLFSLIPGILKDGNKDEFVNESQSIGDLNLFTPLLKLEEREGNLEEKRLKSVIGTLIGRYNCSFCKHQCYVSHIS